MICQAVRFCVTLVSVAHVSTANAESALSLEEYLKQVKANNAGYRGSETLSAGVVKRSMEGTLLLTPTAHASVQHILDKRPNFNPAAQGHKTETQLYTLGVSQQTRYGLTGKVQYTGAFTEISGANPALLREPEFYDSKPSVELSQSLWRNGFGKEVAANQDFLEAGALAQSYGELFKSRMNIMEAELSYWRLALARRTVDVQRQSLERAKRIREWSDKRVKQGLSDRSDFLQADAAVRFRELELRAAEDEVEAASRQFNAKRNSQEVGVGEKLIVPSDTYLASLKEPTEMHVREDVKAAQYQSRAVSAQAEIGYQRNLPQLELFANASLDGRKKNASDATEDSLAAKHPLYVVGLRISAPLDVAKTSQNRAGYNEEKLAAELQLSQKLSDTQKDWNDLLDRFRDAKKRSELAKAIESVQEEKLNYEKDKMRRGRSTTFQVLNFEQDYANAQLATLRTNMEVLNAFAQLKTYGGAQ